MFGNRGYPYNNFGASSRTDFEVVSYSNSRFGYSGFGGGGSCFGSGASNFGGDPSSFGSGASNFGTSKMGFANSNIQEVDWKNVQLSPIKKNVYTEHPIVSERSQSDIDAWLMENQVNLSGEKVPRPIFGFDETGFPEKIVDMLYLHYEFPTSIQSISWPVALSGRDMISIAKTGSGKTLGFLLPALMHIKAQPPRQPGEGPSILILLPTRELAQQVATVAEQYCVLQNLSYACLYGGAPKRAQVAALSRGVDICVATPGRLLDLINERATTMSRCSFLVLDEADRMLDMGFEAQIRCIVSQIRTDRQTLMFSATWPKEIRNLANDFHKNPIYVCVGSLELAANHNIEQNVEVIEEHEKLARLYQLLKQLCIDKEAKILIFVETKNKVDMLTREMRLKGWRALCIHGDKEQRERNWVLSEFRTGQTPILLATDVAARGLDVENIKTVINFDFPNNSEDYVHRIGRTGRRDNKGVAYTFFTPSNASKATGLISVLEEAKQTVPHNLRSLAVSLSSMNFGRPYGRRPGGNLHSNFGASGGFKGRYPAQSYGKRDFQSGDSRGNQYW